MIESPVEQLGPDAATQLEKRQMGMNSLTDFLSLRGIATERIERSQPARSSLLLSRELEVLALS